MKKIFYIIFILLLIPSSLFPKEDKLFIDLSKLDVFVRKGFSEEWIKNIGEVDEWRKISGNITGNRQIVFNKLKNFNLPERNFLSLKRYEPVMFTFLIPFNYDKNKYKNIVPGLYLAYIGGAREIYLNGKKIESEWHLSGNVDIDKITNIRNIVVTLNPELLKNGENLLGFRIFGDPTDMTTGFYHSKSYIISDLNHLENLQNKLISHILIIIYFFIGLYYISIFFYKQEDKYNLIFALFSISISLYNFSRLRTVYYFIPDIDVLNRVELILIYSLLPLMSIFLDLLIVQRIRIFTKIYSIFSIILILLTIPGSQPFINDLLLIWYGTILFPLGYFLFFLIGLSLFRIIKLDYNAIQVRSVFYLFQIVRRALFGSDSGRLLIGVMIMISCAIIDVIDKQFFYYHYDLSRFGFLFFNFGIMMVLSNKIIISHYQFEILNQSMEDNIVSLNKAKQDIINSENIHKSLVEGADHYIFTINSSGNIISANNKFIKDFSLNKKNLNDINIRSLFFTDLDEYEFIEEIILDKIKKCIGGEKDVFFRTSFKSLLKSEPIDIYLTFELIDKKNQDEILIKGYHLIEDSLLKYLELEEQEFEFNNVFIIAEEINHRLTRNLKRYLDEKKIEVVRKGLREAVINAIEHGNLQVSKNDKIQNTANKTYSQFISERQNDIRFKDKKVIIKYSMNSLRAKYIISDMGKGFEYIKYLNSNSLDVNNKISGIPFMKNVFDKVEYNKAGNQITLVINFKYVF